MANYVAYHVHDDDSLLDSCTKYKDYVDKAVELGQKAIAITNHGNIYNWIERKMYAESKGIKMLLGIECYVTEDLCNGNDEKHRDNYHTILIAKNPDGEKEICRLFDTSSKPDHKYYNNRISINELLNVSENVYKISACLASPLNKLRRNPEKKNLLTQLLQCYDYYEIQPHNCEEQKDYNRWLFAMSQIYHKPLIAATDTHSLNKYKSECTTILKLAKRIMTTAEDTFDLTYKSYDELVEMFHVQNALPPEVYLKAIENTNIMAESVIPSQIDHTIKYPKLYGDSDTEIFEKRIWDMYKDKCDKRIIVDSKMWKDRINEELEVFKKVNYVGFMLFMSEMAEWCWANNIPLGYCRGSVGGSAIAYILDIIDVNPLKWHTVFSRFCNVTRAATEVGDIDLDISPSQRNLVQQYIIDRFGLDYTAYVLSIGTIKENGCIDEIGRGLKTKFELEHDKSERDNSPYSIKAISEIKSLYSSKPQIAKERYPEIFYYFDGLVGTNISQSMHPAGVIASPISLTDNYGTFWNDGKHILAINMEECHELQLAKYDCLGLKNIEIIKDTCQMANIPYPKSHNIDWEDKDVWAHITDSPVGIFQFEGAYAFDLLKKYKPQMITHLSTVNASLRPSGESYRKQLIAHEKCKNPSPIIDELLKENDGWLIFQEDTIKFLTDICGLDGAEADNVRRAIGRKQLDRLQAAMPKILDGYCRMSPQPRGIAEKEAQQFLKIIEDSANYQFGYNHSTGYSMIGYTCAYLRHYYPLEFITAYLNNADNQDDIINGTELAKEYKINITPPRFGESAAKYMPHKETNTISKGIETVKFMNAAVSDELYNMSHKNYYDFLDILYDVQETSVNIRQLFILVKIGYFSNYGNMRELTKMIELFDYFKGGKISSIKASDIDKAWWGDIAKKYSSNIGKNGNVLKTYKIRDCKAILRECFEGIRNMKLQDLDDKLKMAAQKEYLGYVDLTTNKEEDRRKLLIEKVIPLKKAGEEPWGYAVFTKSIGSGKSARLTVRARVYNSEPLKEMNIIYAKSVEKNRSGYWYLIDYEILSA